MNNEFQIKGCRIPVQQIQEMGSAARINYFGSRFFLLKDIDGKEHEWLYHEILNGALKSHAPAGLLKRIVQFKDAGYDKLSQFNPLTKALAEKNRFEEAPEIRKLIIKANERIIADNEANESKEDLIVSIKTYVPRSSLPKLDCLVDLDQITPDKGKELYSVLQLSSHKLKPSRRKRFYEITLGAKEHGVIQLKIGDGEVFSLPLLLVKASSKVLYEVILDLGNPTSEAFPVPSSLFGLEITEQHLQLFCQVLEKSWQFDPKLDDLFQQENLFQLLALAEYLDVSFLMQEIPLYHVDFACLCQTYQTITANPEIKSSVPLTVCINKLIDTRNWDGLQGLMVIGSLNCRFLAERLFNDSYKYYLEISDTTLFHYFKIEKQLELPESPLRMTHVVRARLEKRSPELIWLFLENGYGDQFPSSLQLLVDCFNHPDQMVAEKGEEFRKMIPQKIAESFFAKTLGNRDHGEVLLTSEQGGSSLALPLLLASSHAFDHLACDAKLLESVSIPSTLCGLSITGEHIQAFIEVLEKYWTGYSDFTTHLNNENRLQVVLLSDYLRVPFLVYNSTLLNSCFRSPLSIDQFEQIFKHHDVSQDFLVKGYIQYWLEQLPSKQMNQLLLNEPLLDFTSLLGNDLKSQISLLQIVFKEPDKHVLFMTYFFECFRHAHFRLSKEALLACVKLEKRLFGHTNYTGFV